MELDNQLLQTLVKQHLLKAEDNQDTHDRLQLTAAALIIQRGSYVGRSELMATLTAPRAVSPLAKPMY